MASGIDRHATIAELSVAIADGATTAAALLDACCQAIEADDRDPLPLHAIRCLDPTAPAQADAAPEGPLHGIPVIIKDNIDVAGLPTTSGSRALARALPRRDATVVERLRASGAVLIGKANMAEMSFDVRSRSGLAGDVRNPFRRTVTSGGSSGGTAAAVAAGLAVVGLGTDTGGSIRNPAGFTGLVGLRPTHGVVPLNGIAPLSPTTDTVGPIARSVGDAALLFAVLAGRSPSSLPTGAIKFRRIGVLRQFAGTDPAVTAALASVLAALGQQGAKIVDPLFLPDNDVPRAGRPHIVDAEFVPAFDAYLANNFAAGATLPRSVAAIVAAGNHLDELEPVLHARLDPTVRSPAAWASVTRARATMLATLTELMNEHRLDAFAYPTSAAAATSLEKPASGWAPELAAMTGWPAISIPAGLANNDVPLGVDLLARAHDETLLFELGIAVEKVLGPRRLP